MRSLVLLAATLVATPAFANPFLSQEERQRWGLVREWQDVTGNRDGIWENEGRPAGERSWFGARTDELGREELEGFARWKQGELAKYGMTRAGRSGNEIAEGHALLNMARYGRRASEFDDGFETAADGAIYTQRWDAKGQQKLVTVIVPGYTESTLDWTHVANRLNEAGSRVYVFDPPGQGLSYGRRGDVGDYREWVDAYRTVLAKAQRENPGAKVVVMAHSTGGGIVLDDAHDRVNGQIHTKGPDGYVLSAPYLEMTPNAFNRVSGALSKIPFANRLQVPVLVKLSDDEVLAPRLKQFQRATGARNTLHFVNRMREMTDRHTRWLEEPSTGLTVPVAVAQSVEDNVTNVEATREFVGRTPGATFREHAGSTHDLQWSRTGLEVLTSSWSDVAERLLGANASRDASTLPGGARVATPIAGGADAAGIAR